MHRVILEQVHKGRVGGVVGEKGTDWKWPILKGNMTGLDIAELESREGRWRVFISGTRPIKCGAPVP